MKTMVKISGAYLKGRSATPFDYGNLLSVAEVLRQAARETTDRLLVVVGGGNVVRGKEFLPSDADRDSIDYAGMLASVQNVLVLRRALRDVGADAEVIVPDAFVIPGTRHFSALSESPAGESRILLFGGGIGRPGYSTDTAAVLNAIRCGADEVIYLKDGVDGLYDRHPQKHKDARFLPEIRYEAYCAQKLEAVDTDAIERLAGHGIRTYITGCAPENLRYLLAHHPTKVWTEGSGALRYSLLTD